MKSWRSFLFVPVLVALGAVVGGLLGPGAMDASAASGEEEIESSLKTFTQVYALVETDFADKVDPDKAIYDGAIPGMLRTLDPHSSFFDPRAFQLMREDQRGHYFGVGMSVAPKGNRTMVIAPFPGSPAYKAGIRPGDVIMFVNDKSSENLSTSEVADLLKGPKGTQVQVRMSREGVQDLLTFAIIRDEIPRYSVPEAFFVKPGILYLDIESFTETTSREVEQNIKRVGEQNVKGLILDLRSNPGGLLNEGVAVAERFLEKGQVVVKHSGRASAERRYQTSQSGSGRNYPIVVLVNRFSASAAEIVAGALQDHDRGWIFGENTFGKGLVQTVFPLNENTGLALTTARYYTPSGRLIQRDYANQSFFDYYYRKNLESKNLSDVGMTDTGRKVYGGGGIAPDEKYEEPKGNRFQALTIRNYAFINFAAQLLASGDRNKITKEWAPDENVLQRFREYLLKEKYDFTEADFADNKDFISQQLRREVFVNVFDQDSSRRFAIENDPMVLAAIDSLPKAKDLLDRAKKLLVQRNTRTVRFDE